MDDAHQSKEATQHKAVKISKDLQAKKHSDIVKMVQANHMRTVQSVKQRQDSVLYKDSGS